MGPSSLKAKLIPQMIRTEGLTKRFVDKGGGTVVAVNGLSFEAHPGRVFGLLGVNGAGKTTTLRMLSTVLTPSAGTATVDGIDVTKDPGAVRARIGFLSTSTALYGRLTARETLSYFGGLYGLKGADLRTRLDDAIARLEIGPFEDRLCDKLSTGQKQRVSIARATLHDPPVMFFDEPTAGLDVVASQAVLEFIEAARDRGKTILFSTHIMSEVERLCDDVAVVHDGRLVGSGSAESLKEQTGETTLEGAFLKLVRFERALGGLQTGGLA